MAPYLCIVNEEQKQRIMKKALVILIMCVTFSVSAQTYLPDPWGWTENISWEWTDNSGEEIERLNNQIDSLRTVINARKKEEPKKHERTYEKPLTSFNSQDFHRLFQMGVHLQRWEQKQKSIKYNIYKLN